MGIETRIPRTHNRNSMETVALASIMSINIMNTVPIDCAMLFFGCLFSSMI